MVAIEQGIEFSVKGTLPKQMNLRIYSLSTILFNLLDNAIEANMKNKYDNKYINLEFGYYNNYLSIRISNPVIDIDINKSLKEDRRLHGFGIINIKKELEKCQGDMKILNKASQFTIDIILKYK